MNNLKNNEQINELGEKAKNLVQQGNARHVVIRDAQGNKMAEFSLTIAAIIGVILMFMGPVSWLLIFAAAIYGMTQKIRVEVVRDLSDSDDSIPMD